MNRPAHETRLVDRLRAGDQTAVIELDRTYGSKISGLVMRFTKSREDTEEIVQDVLVKVFFTINGFRGDSALGSWIYRIAFNTAMSRLRSQRFTRPREVSGLEEAFDGGAGTGRQRPAGSWSSLPDESYLRAQLRERLAAALLSVPAIYRTPVLLRDMQGLSTDEASAALQIKSQTLKSRLHRGRLALRKQLAEFEDGLRLRAAV